MIHMRLLLISALLICGCAHRGGVHYPKLHKQERKRLAQVIEQTISQSGLKPNLGLKVVSLRTGETLYERNADHLYKPASNNKLYTAAAALKILAPQYRFHTTVWVDSLKKGTSFVTRLVLKGSGDPDLALNDLRHLAEDVSRNITTIDTLVLDNTLFDSTPFGPGWMWDEGSAWYFAHVDALTVNDNCVDLIIQPSEPGEPPRITINPDTKYVTILNQAITLEDTTGFVPLKIERRWKERSNTIEISGNVLSTDMERIFWCNIEEPTRFAGTVFRKALISQGVQINGPTIIDSVSTNSTLIASHRSAPLIHSIINFMKISDNLTGELLVKTLGYESGKEQGNWNNGIKTIKIFLHDSVAIDTSTFRMVDGSGISRYNLTSPEQLVALLTYIYNDPTINAEYMASLPTGGRDGSLRNRMKGRSRNDRIRAKTGTLSGVSSLSGYVFTMENEPLAFSIMMNGFVGSAAPYRRLQDDITLILTQFKR